MSNTVISQEWRKARKAHYCDFCSQRIEPGDKYSHSYQVYDGEVFCWKSHRFCDDFADAQRASDRYYYAEGVSTDQWQTALDDWLTDELGDDDAQVAWRARREIIREEGAS